MTKRRSGSRSAISESTSVFRPPRSRSSRNWLPVRHGPGVSSSILMELLSNLPWLSALVSQAKTFSTGRFTFTSAENFNMDTLQRFVRCCALRSFPVLASPSPFLHYFYFFLAQTSLPAIGGKNGLVEALVGQVEPGGAGVVEVREGSLLLVC